MTTGLLWQMTTVNSSLFVNPKLKNTEIHGYKLRETEILDKKKDRDPWLHPSSADKLHSAAVLFVLNDFKSSQWFQVAAATLSPPRPSPTILCFDWAPPMANWNSSLRSGSSERYPNNFFYFHFKPFIISFIVIWPQILEYANLSSLIDHKLTNMHFFPWYIHMNT